MNSSYIIEGVHQIRKYHKTKDGDGPMSRDSMSKFEEK
jgi:hypothetical protein